MPSFPAFLLLLAGIPLLVPRLGHAIAVRFPPGAGRPRRLERLIVVTVFLFVLVPAVLLAATRVQVGPATVKNDAQSTSIPVGGGLDLKVQPAVAGTRLSWKTPYDGSIGVFYVILRSRPRFPDPSNPQDRTAVDGVACRSRVGGAAQDCHLFMDRVDATRKLHFVDHPPPGRWTYRVALGSNWLDDPSGGDSLLVSRPVTVTVP
jgi:hypothetical protein